jgi:Ca2+-binding RTX toxin-like protein
MGTAANLRLAALASQGSYAALLQELPILEELVRLETGTFTPLQARRSFVVDPTDASSEKLERIDHLPNDPTGLSATLFLNRADGKHYLAIRGTDDAQDRLEDARLAVTGWAGTQFLSLYRYYRRLTTPAGEQVAYSAEERALLQRLNAAVPGLPFQLGALLSDVQLSAALSSDRGVARLDGTPGSVLIPGAPVSAVGHSLGGHLAILFGRAFPFVAENIYTFNAPGIAPWGDVLLTSAGLAASDPAKVVHVVAGFGTDFASLYGTRPGQTLRVFNESGGAAHNHSIIPIADSLALYELLEALNPAFPLRNEEISALLAAASVKPEASLEAALDVLRRVIAGATDATPIAADRFDVGARDEFYKRLYALRDGYADGRDWAISSLAGVAAGTIAFRAQLVPAYRYALAHLDPLAALGAARAQTEAPPRYDPVTGAGAVSDRWLEARAEMLARLLEARTADRPYGLSGGRENLLFVDLGRGERFAALTASLAAGAESFRHSEATLNAYLDGLVYGSKTVFGADDAARPDTIEGSDGADRLFGAGGDDVLRGGSGDDQLEGGAGEDRLEGGSGNDVLLGGPGRDVLEGGMGFDAYELAQVLEADRIRDEDGAGAILAAGTPLTGGTRGADEMFRSADGSRRFELIGDLLRVDGVLEIEDFENGDLGIWLSQVPSATSEAPQVASMLLGDLRILDGNPGTPTIIDPAGDGYGNVLRSEIAFPEHFDIFFGQPGNTRIETADGPDFVEEWHDGDDWIVLGVGRDFGFGGEGNDRIEGGPDKDFLLGGRGDDALYAETGASDAEGPPPAATLPALEYSVEFVSGGEGHDLLVGTPARDYLEGGAGDDQIVGGAGDDTLLGDGRGISEHVAAEAYDNAARDFGLGTLALDDTGIYPGDPEGPTLWQWSFTAELARVAAGGAPAEYWDSSDAGRDTIYAGSGDDRVAAGGADDLVYGGTGEDWLEGGRGADELFGEDDDDRLYGEGLEGAAFASANPEQIGGNDRLFGGAGDDQLYGQAGDDLLSGDSGDDQLFGGEGDDTLLGGAGSDQLRGGPGRDLLDGGRGNDLLFGDVEDVYLLGRGRGSDRVVFEPGTSPGGAIQADAGVAAEEIETWFDGTDTNVGIRGTADRLAFAGPPGGLGNLSAELVARLVPIEQSHFAGHRYGTDGDDIDFGTSGSDIFVGSPGNDSYAGAGGDDQYFFGPAQGTDRLMEGFSFSLAPPGSPFSSFDVVTILDTPASAISVHASGNDVLLRWPGTEVRLVDQLLPSHGVERVRIPGEAEWDAAELFARAQPLAAPEATQVGAPLGFATATVDVPFEYELPAEAFIVPETGELPTLALVGAPGDAVPVWLQFDAGTGRLSGTPAESDIGVSVVLVAASLSAASGAVSPIAIWVEPGAPAAPAEPATPPPAESTPTADAEPPSLPAASQAPLTNEFAGTGPAAASVATPLEVAGLVPAFEPVGVEAQRRELVSPPAAASGAFAITETASSLPLSGPEAIFEAIEARLDVPVQPMRTASFIERYAEAIEAFEARRRAREVPAEEELSPEEIGRYNEALHAWLDRDAERLAAGRAEEGFDWAPDRFFSIYAGVRDLHAEPETLARPGLQGAIRSLDPPGLREGLRDLSL